MIKYLVLLLVIVLVLWLARRPGRGARPPSREAGQQRKAVVDPRPMVSCASCGVHLPRDEALPG
ncbi:MAG TPA: PP0621 family protein, partial [Ramlibacter sp.]|nr:PP0621 family protein [Ramlibacter sp.]